MTATRKQKTHIQLTLNGEFTEVAFAPHKTLLEVLREDLALTGTKHGCELGECGVCTVLIDGQPMLSCLFLGLDAEGREVTTIEGLAINGELHRMQHAFWDEHGLQCGYCTPGMIMAAVALLADNPAPSEREIREGISGNLCRCTGYQHIVNAIQRAAAQR